MEVLFATGNIHKIEEANEVGLNHGIHFKQVDCPYPEKRSDSVVDVAEEGVKFVYEKINKPVIVEDSGLLIEALRGFPGPYSRFVYDKIGCEGIIRLMAGVEDKSARFISAIGYADEKGVNVFQGRVKGVLIDEMRGVGGFGYDPIFVPLEYDKTFAQDPKNKNEVSHRRKAVELLCGFLASR